MSIHPLFTVAHTGTCTLLTAGTRAALTVPTGMSHRTGCSNVKLSKVTTRGTTASAAAPGPETPTEAESSPHPWPPDQHPGHPKHPTDVVLCVPNEETRKVALKSAKMSQRKTRCPVCKAENSIQSISNHYLPKFRIIQNRVVAPDVTNSPGSVF